MSCGNALKVFLSTDLVLQTLLNKNNCSEFALVKTTKCTMLSNTNRLDEVGEFLDGHAGRGVLQGEAVDRVVVRDENSVPVRDEGVERRVVLLRPRLGTDAAQYHPLLDQVSLCGRGKNSKVDLLSKGVSTPETNWIHPEWSGRIAIHTRDELDSSRMEWKNCHPFQWQFVCSIWGECRWAFDCVVVFNTCESTLCFSCVCALV